MRAFNLIPADERGGAGIGAGKSGGSAFVVLGLLGVLAIFALLYGQASRQISSQTSKIATLNTQAQAARLAPYVDFMTMHEQRVQAVDQLVDSRFDWAHAFHELGRVLPVEVALTSLSGTVGHWLSFVHFWTQKLVCRYVVHTSLPSGVQSLSVAHVRAHTSRVSAFATK